MSAVVDSSGSSSVAMILTKNKKIESIHNYKIKCINDIQINKAKKPDLDYGCV